MSHHLRTWFWCVHGPVQCLADQFPYCGHILDLQFRGFETPNLYFAAIPLRDQHRLDSSLARGYQIVSYTSNCLEFSAVSPQNTAETEEEEE